MSALAAEMDQYLALRRAFGFQMKAVESILRPLIKFADSENEEVITVALFKRWRSVYGSADGNTWAARYTIVREFAQWLHGSDARHELMPKGLFVNRYRRKPPYIFSEDEVQQLVDRASRLPSELGLRGLCYTNLFGLIAVAGLRVSETININTDDIDFGAGVVTVREGKLGKPRLLPLSQTALHQLENFVAKRDRLLGARVQPLFVSDSGSRPSMKGVHYNFAQVSESIGLRRRLPFRRVGTGPRIHDLRHTFAVRVMVGWYRQGLDVRQEMYKLTTYLGHDDPAHTYWYIEAVPELLRLASDRAQQTWINEARQ